MIVCVAPFFTGLHGLMKFFFFQEDMFKDYQILQKRNKKVICDSFFSKVAIKRNPFTEKKILPPLISIITVTVFKWLLSWWQATYSNTPFVWYFHHHVHHKTLALLSQRKEEVTKD